MQSSQTAARQRLTTFELFLLTKAAVASCTSFSHPKGIQVSTLLVHCMKCSFHLRDATSVHKSYALEWVLLVMFEEAISCNYLCLHMYLKAVKYRNSLCLSAWLPIMPERKKCAQIPSTCPLCPCPTIHYITGPAQAGHGAPRRAARRDRGCTDKTSLMSAPLVPITP